MHFQDNRNPLQVIPQRPRDLLIECGWKPGTIRSCWSWSWNKLKIVNNNVACSDIEWLTFAERFWDDKLLSPCNSKEEQIASRSMTARSILLELNGIHARDKESSQQKYRRSLLFGDDMGMSDLCLIKEFGAILNSFTLPIGELRSQATVLISEDEKVFLLGSVGSGVYFVGNSFGEAMDKYFSGEMLQPVCFDKPVRDDFIMDEFILNHPQNPGIYYANVHSR